MATVAFPSHYNRVQGGPPMPQPHAYIQQNFSMVSYVLDVFLTAEGLKCS